MSDNWKFLQRGPLVATPVPNRRETAIGYVLRLAQTNGYHSPSVFLPKGSEIHASALGGSVKTLQTLTGMSIEQAERLVLHRSAEGYRLFQHDLPSHELSIDRHRICPACVEEDGILDASWHLTCITHCAKHGLELMEQCDACGRGLGLSRQGVGICRCDRLLICSQSEASCSPQLLSLMRVIRSRLYVDTKIATAPKTLSHFDELDLASLLAVVRAMHKHAAARRGIKFGNRGMSNEIMGVVARAMHAFTKGLRAVQAVLHDGAVVMPGQGRGSERAFDWYYDRQYDLRSIPELSFIGDAIRTTSRGGTDHFAKPTPLPSTRPERTRRAADVGKLDGRSWEDEWVRVEEFACQTGCSNSGLQRAADLRLVRGCVKQQGVQTLHRSQLARLKPSRHLGLEMSDAAGFLGITPSFWHWLAVYHFPVTYIPDAGGPFALEDITRVRDSFLAAHGRVLTTRPYLTLARFLNAAPHTQKLSASQAIGAIKNPDVKIRVPTRPGQSAAQQWYDKYLAREAAAAVEHREEFELPVTEDPEPVSNELMWAIADRLISEKLAKSLSGR